MWAIIASSYRLASTRAIGRPTTAGEWQTKLSTPFSAVRPQHRLQRALYYQKRNTLIGHLPEEPLHTATGRLQRLLQPHREPLSLSSSCYTSSAGLGVTRLEFVRYGLLIEVWSVPPLPPRNRQENAKFAGRTRSERHESVATHCGCDCAPSWRQRSPSGDHQFEIVRRYAIVAVIVIV